MRCPVWQVNTVVIATNPEAPRLEQGHDPTYAAAFMTAALGRRPTIQAGAWVWDHVQLGLSHPLLLEAGTLAACTAAAEAKSGGFVASMAVVRCVGRAGAGLAAGQAPWQATTRAVPA